MPTQPTDDYNYETVGFNKFLSRAQEVTQETLEDQSSLTTNQVPSGNIMYGKQVSPDGKLTVDWGNNQITFNSGSRNRVIIGYFPEENKFGVRVIDATGTAQLDETY